GGVREWPALRIHRNLCGSSRPVWSGRGRPHQLRSWPSDALSCRGSVGGRGCVEERQSVHAPSGRFSESQQSSERDRLRRLVLRQRHRTAPKLRLALANHVLAPEERLPQETSVIAAKIFSV